VGPLPLVIQTPTSYAAAQKVIVFEDRIEFEVASE
jgi:hypothetical protein